MPAHIPNTVPAAELFEAQRRVAMASPDHLKEWLSRTNRQFLTLNMLDFVDALWPSKKEAPDAMEAFMVLLEAYVAHRRTLPTGWDDPVTLPTGGVARVPLQRTDMLEPDETATAIATLRANAEALAVDRRQRNATVSK